MARRALILTTVKRFVADDGGEASGIVEDTRLLQEGFVDSFKLVDLIVSLEGALSLSLSTGQLLPEDFESVTVLMDRIDEIAG